MPSSAPRLVVADAGPLIALARVDQLHCLRPVLGQVLVPQKVREECLRGAQRDDELVLVAALTGGFDLQLVDDSVRPEVEARELDPGEVSVLSVALERGCGVLIDDRRGRRAADALGIPFIGTVGVLVLAKRHGLLSRVAPHLDALVKSGYFLSRSLRRSALRASGED